MNAGTGAGDASFGSILEDFPIEHKLKFADGSEVQLTKHVPILAVIIQDRLNAQPDNDLVIPIQESELSAECFELILKIMREVREKEPALYRRFLKHEAVRSDIRNDYSDVFNGVPNDLIIQAANAAELFSFTVVSRILVWYLAEMTTKMEIDELVKLLDGTPLDKKILEEFEVEADDAIWQTCPGMKKSIFEAN